MREMGDIKVLFVAGFGPIVRHTTASRKLYQDTFDIPFKEEKDGYLHTEALHGVKSFALWPLSQAAQSCFGTDSWPGEIPVPQAWLEFDVAALSRQQGSLSREAIECSSRPRKSRGVRL
jgi:hypothetical protein